MLYWKRKEKILPFFSHILLDLVKKNTLVSKTAQNRFLVLLIINTAFIFTYDNRMSNFNKCKNNTDMIRKMTYFLKFESVLYHLTRESKNNLS